MTSFNAEEKNASFCYSCFDYFCMKQCQHHPASS